MKSLKINKTFKAMLITSLSSLLLSSCSNFIIFKTLTFKILVNKGSSSFAMCAYYKEINKGNLIFTYSDEEFEQAFNDESYRIIVSDFKKGTEYSKANNYNYKVAGIISRGNASLIPLDKNNVKKDIYTVAYNNDEGYLGEALRYIYQDKSNVNLLKFDLNDYDFYNYFFSGQYKEDNNQIDYLCINEPFGAKLIMDPNSAMRDESHDEENLNKAYAVSNIAASIYNKSRDETYNSGIVQDAVFVLADAYENYKDDIDNVIDVLNRVLPETCVEDASSAVQEFINIDEDFDKQFDVLGISYREVVKLQCWDQKFFERLPYNRLMYSKKGTNTVTRSFINKYYQLLNKDALDEAIYLDRFK